MKNNEVIVENRFRTVASPGAWPSWIDARRQYITHSLGSSSVVRQRKSMEKWHQGNQSSRGDQSSLKEMSQDRAQWRRNISQWSSAVANPHRGRSTSEWV